MLSKGSTAHPEKWCHTCPALLANTLQTIGQKTSRTSSHHQTEMRLHGILWACSSCSAQCCYPALLEEINRPQQRSRQQYKTPHFLLVVPGLFTIWGFISADNGDRNKCYAVPARFARLIDHNRDNRPPHDHKPAGCADSRQQPRKHSGMLRRSYPPYLLRSSGLYESNEVTGRIHLHPMNPLHVRGGAQHETGILRHKCYPSRSACPA